MKKKIEKEIYWHQKNSQLKWKDIKHLDLKDDDIITSTWEYEGDGGGYWHGSIIRMVEETDEQYEKRLSRESEDNERRKKMRYESYLKLKAEFENKTE